MASTVEPWRPWSPDAGAATPGLARVIGHRGAAARAPENTLAGLREAHRLGCAWVEFDVMLSRDGVPVLIHDETVDRTTNGRGRVPDLTFAELRRLDAGVRFGARFPAEPIPTLHGAIDLCLELGLAANVEIKPARGYEPETGRAVAEVLVRRWPGDGPRLLISSFERPSLQAALEVAPAVPRGLLAEPVPADWEAAMLEYRCTTLNLSHRRVRPKEIRALAERRVPMLLYTVNEPWRARDLLNAGAAGVFTDAPDGVLGAVKSHL
jgi:glycerophosphoryl diester phosphodiesterase